MNSRSFIKFNDLEIPSFFLLNKTRKEPVKSLPVFRHKSKLSPGSKSRFGHALSFVPGSSLPFRLGSEYSAHSFFGLFPFVVCTELLGWG